MTKKEETTALSTALADDMKLGEIFVESGFFSDAKEKSQAIVKILAGREAGLEPIESMTSIHIIKGKISFGSNMMAAAVKKNPNYDYKVTEHTDKKCIINFFEITYDLKGKPTKELAGTSEFTMEDAKRAGVMTSGGSWYKYPKAMLFARAMSAGVRYYCPDVFGHAPVYVPEELGEKVDEEGEPVNITPTTSKPKKPAKQPKVVKTKDKVPVKEVEPEPEIQNADFKDVNPDESHPEKENVPDTSDDDYDCTCPEACPIDGHPLDSEEDPEPEEPTESIKIDGVDEDTKPREALAKIMEYAMDNNMADKVRPVIIKHYADYEDGSRYPYHIPEQNIIAIVLELSGMKLKKAEKNKSCKKKDCKTKVTEPESEEQDGLCLEHWTESQED